MFINTTNIIEIADKIELKVNDATALIFIAEETDIDVNELIKNLNDRYIKFTGGVFPKVIDNQSVYSEGIVVETIANEVDNFVVQNLNSKSYQIPSVKLIEGIAYCAFTFVDGLTSNISHYLSELYRAFGNRLSYFGGGAGSLTLEQSPCVFNNTGLYQDAAVVFIAEIKSTIGVKHGWEKIQGPLIATKTDKNIIKQINWRNAFDVYSEIVNADSKIAIQSDNFFDIAKGYPFGIVKQEAEYVVRDPLFVNEKGELVCVGEVPENTVLDVLKGENKALIAAAKTAAVDVVDRAVNPSCGLIIDCISRILFLEDEFQEELDGVVNTLKKKNKELPISGALTLGEISSYGSNYLELFNKTLVVGLFEN